MADARTIKAYFKLRLGTKDLFGLMTISGLSRTYEKTLVRDGDASGDVAAVIVGPGEHDDVEIELTTRKTQIDQIEADLKAHTEGDEEDPKARYDTVTVTGYSDKKFSKPILNYAMQNVRITGLEYDGFDRESQDPVLMKLTLSPATGSGSGASGTPSS
jgi:hypothetical protein